MKRISILLVACVVLVGGARVVGAWSGATTTPPSGNADAPINIGSANQSKNANLGVNGLAVFGNTLLSGSSRYLNFGMSTGDLGYGIWDDAGTLKFKNSGATAWQSLQAAGFGAWAPSINDIYNTNIGNVGIGSSATPGAKLQVTNDANYNGTPALILNSFTTPAKQMKFGYDQTNNFSFIQSINTGVAFTPIILNALGGNVGIGSTAPAAKLSIANGADDPINYGKALQITNVNGNRQQMAFIRDGFNVVSAGYNGASSVWGFGAANVTDSSFTPTWLSIDAANGNVGIGTANPGSLYNLDVSGSNQPRIRVVNTSSAANSSSGLVLDSTAQSGNARWLIETGTTLGVATDLAFYNLITGTTAMIMQSGGNVGIGLAPGATNKLDVNGNINVPTGSCFKVNGTCITGSGTVIAGTINQMAYYAAPGTAVSGTSALTLSGTDIQITDNILQNNARSLYAKNAAGTSQPWMWPRESNDVMYTNIGANGWSIRNNAGSNSPPLIFIQNGGNVGIGTASPNYKLDVNGTSNFVGTQTQSGGYAYVGTFNSGLAYPAFNNTLAVANNFSNGNAELNMWNTINPSTYVNTGFRFMQQTAASTYRDLMFLKQDGSVGIGTVSPTARLTVTGASGSNAIGSAANGYYDIGAGSIAAGTSIFSYGSICAGRSVGNCSGTGGVNINSTGVTFPDGTTQTTAAVGGASQWTTSGSNIYYGAGPMGGSVGIGTVSPTVGTKLDVSGITRTTDLTIAGIAPGSTNCLQILSTGVVGTSGAPCGGSSQWTTSGGSTIYYNGGNVGVGVIAPGVKLHVAGNTSYASGSTYSGAFANLTNPLLRLNLGYDSSLDAGLIQASQEGTTFNKNILLQPSGGSVGIGITTAPGAKLEVGGQIKITGGTPGLNKVLTSDANGLASWEAAAGGSSQWTTSGANISNSNTGNVGIGATSPFSRLDVSGQVDDVETNYRTSATYSQMTIHDSDNTTNSALAIGYRWQSGVAEYGRLQAYNSSGGTVLALNPNGGNVGIGTAIPGAKLDVAGNLLLSALRSTLFITGDNTTTHRGGIQMVTYDNGLHTILTPTDQAGTTINSTIQLGGQGSFNSNVVNLALAPTASVTAGSFLYPSDRRLKENIAPLQNALSKISQISGVSFVWKPGTPQAGKADVGVIAQDVEKVVPEAVHTDEKGIKSVDYARLVPLLVSAINEQQKEIDDLKAEVKALKTQ